MTYDEAIEVAVEHLQWCRDTRYPIGHLLSAINAPDCETGDDILHAVAVAYMNLQTLLPA